MKKIFVLLLIGGVLLAFTSCKKNCVCKEKLSNVEETISLKELKDEGFDCNKELEKALLEYTIAELEKIGSEIPEGLSYNCYKN